MTDVTTEELDFYFENGYLIKNLFSHSEVDRIYNIHIKYVDENYSALMHIDRKEKELLNFIKSSKVVTLIEAMLKGEAYALMSQMLFKKPDTIYSKQSWTIHQDNSYHQNPNGLTITVNIACEDSDIENGTIYLFPGSHKEGLFNFKPRKSFRENHRERPGNTIELPQKYIDNKVDLIMKKGDVLFMHGNCAHGSYGNSSKMRSRPIYAVTYIKKGESFAIGKNANRKEILLH